MTELKFGEQVLVSLVRSTKVPIGLMNLNEQSSRTYSIALEIRHAIGLVEGLGNRSFATACRTGNDPNVLLFWR
jgi:hypothetical protein